MIEGGLGMGRVWIGRIKITQARSGSINQMFCEEVPRASVLVNCLFILRCLEQAG